jgi:simple sugar transport system permease protein
MIVFSILKNSIKTSVPLIFAASGGMYCERAGVINIALEGMMLLGAFTGSVILYFTGSITLCILAAALSGSLMVFIHFIFVVLLKVNEIVSGVAINIFASGFTIFLTQYIFEGQRSFIIDSGGLLHLGPFSILSYMSIIILLLSGFSLFKTAWGLRLRSVGEAPLTASSVGINLNRYKLMGCMLSGLLSGLGGVYLPLYAGSFTKDMTAGRGFIALAALIFGRWKPGGIFIACMIFGVAESVQMNLQGVDIPSQFIQMIPYLATIIALISFYKRRRSSL